MMIIMAKKPIIAILIPKFTTDTESFTKVVEKLESKNFSVLFFQFEKPSKNKKQRRQDIKAFIESWKLLKCVLVPMPGSWESIFPGLTTYYELSRLRRLPIVFYKYFINEDDVFAFQDSPDHIKKLIKEEAMYYGKKTKQSD